MSRPRALDLFCGAGGAAMGLYRAGFDVIGVDIKPQPRYPFPFVRGDALRPPMRLKDFDLVWASPPCQGYSRMRRLPWHKDRTYPLLVEQTRNLLHGVKCSVIENVCEAPITGVTLRGGMFKLPFRRARRFETSFLVMVPSRSYEPVTRPGHYFGPNGGRLYRQMEKAGINWPMTPKERSEAIPPAYSEHIGRYAMIALGRAEA